jgi:hypothetical protein
VSKLQRRAKGEEGAILLLVLFFATAIGLSLAALVSLAGSNLSATAQLTQERNIEYSADAVMDGAIQAVRSVAPVPTASPACPNFPSGGPWLAVNRNSGSIIVTCSMGTFAFPTTTCTYGVNPCSGRTVQFFACPASDASSCSAHALLVANVEYEDVCSGPGEVGCSFPNNTSTVTIENWIVKRANT